MDRKKLEHTWAVMKETPLEERRRFARIFETMLQQEIRKKGKRMKVKNWAEEITLAFAEVRRTAPLPLFIAYVMLIEGELD